MTPTYCYLHLRGSGRDQTQLRQALTGQVLGAWRQSGITVWGIWEGLFGVASNELIVMAASAAELTADAFTAALPEGVTALDVLTLRPTVRPDGTAPCDRPGLYVFRFFRVRDQDVDEVAALSREAWETFENTDAYRAEPQGLFRSAVPSATWGRMLLVTWYDGLESWQTSRRPAPEATENFQRRRGLTDGTVALATRLVTDFPP
ncbi:MAG: hypothetical protein AB7I04_04910 [Pseudomonadales bacterium]